MTSAEHQDPAARRFRDVSGRYLGGIRLPAADDPATAEPAVELVRDIPEGEVVIIPVSRKGPRSERPVGVFVIGRERLQYRPAVDVRSLGMLAVAAATVAAAAAAALAAAGRRPEVGPVTMGPGGWVSVRGARIRGVGVRSARERRRPLWARLLRASRLDA